MSQKLKIKLLERKIKILNQEIKLTWVLVFLFILLLFLVGYIEESKISELREKQNDNLPTSGKNNIQ